MNSIVKRCVTGLFIGDTINERNRLLPAEYKKFHYLRDFWKESVAH